MKIGDFTAQAQERGFIKVVEDKLQSEVEDAEIPVETGETIHVFISSVGIALTMIASPAGDITSASNDVNAFIDGQVEVQGNVVTEHPG